MEKFFNPRSVVVVGASNSPFNLGATICNILQYLKFEGNLFAVNTRAEAVHGCPGYSSITEIGEPIELAIIITPSRVVPDFVRQCGEKGIKNIIIESAGFSEEGEEGSRLQEEVHTYAREHGIRFLGPNCLGVLDTRSRFCCFFGIIPGKYDDAFSNVGTISYVIQSGGVGALIMDSFQTDVTDVNKMVSIGNKEDVDEADLIDFFDRDPDTEVIGMYLESIKNGRKLLEAARKSQKPIMIFKVGRTSEGARAALSHTAGMANNDVIFENACRQAGIIRLKAISELYSLPKIFTSMPPLKGKRVAVFTNSGAFGGITADLLVDAGLSMARLNRETQEKLAKTGKLYNVANPVDLGPTIAKQTFIDIFDILLSSEEVDGLLPVPNVWQQVVIDAIMELEKMCRHYGKPAAIYIPNAADRIIQIRNANRISVFESPEEAVRALTVSYQHYRYSMKKGS